MKLLDIDYQLYILINILQIYVVKLRTTIECANVDWLDFFLSKLYELTIFHTLILSNFNSCPLAWHCCSKANIKLEKIQ